MALKNTVEYLTECFYKVKPKNLFNRSFWKAAKKIIVNTKSQLMENKRKLEEAEMERYYEVEAQLGITDYTVPLSPSHSFRN